MAGRTIHFFALIDITGIKRLQAYSASQPPTPPANQLRQYTDELKAVRVLYSVTALRTVVVVAYIEV
ncbi:hypothetical protein [Streptomyces sp. NPDC052127]|uniref:hypothetical protein n=1 Tax=Streptomyces sp. NPDC052127 TaxID=3155679 RepID=UPI00342A6896